MFSFRFRFRFIFCYSLFFVPLCCAAALRDNGPIVPAYYERVKGARKTRVSSHFFTVVDANVNVLSIFDTNREAVGEGGTVRIKR